MEHFEQFTWRFSICWRSSVSSGKRAFCSGVSSTWSEIGSMTNPCIPSWTKPCKIGKKFHQIFSYLWLSITDYICTYIHHDQRHQHHHQSSHPLPTSSAVSSVPTRRSCITWGVDRWMLVWKILVLNLPQKLLICYNSQNSLLVFKLLFPNLGQKAKENISPAPVVLAP